MESTATQYAWIRLESTIGSVLVRRTFRTSAISSGATSISTSWPLEPVVADQNRAEKSTPLSFRFKSKLSCDVALVYPKRD